MVDIFEIPLVVFVIGFCTVQYFLLVSGKTSCNVLLMSTLSIGLFSEESLVLLSRIIYGISVPYSVPKFHSSNFVFFLDFTVIARVNLLQK